MQKKSKRKQSCLQVDVGLVKSKFVCKLPLGNIFITERCLHLLIITLHTEQNLSRAHKRLEEVPLTDFDLCASSSCT